MQEAELKRREEERRKKEGVREEKEQTKGKKKGAEVVLNPDDRAPEKIAKKHFKSPFLQPKEFTAITIREYRFNQEVPEISASTIPFLQPKEINEIKAKIKAFFMELAEIKPTKREILKIRVKTKAFGGVSRKILAFNSMIPNTEKRNISLAVPDLRKKHFDALKTRKIRFDLELREISASKRLLLVPKIEMKTFSGVISKKQSFGDGSGGKEFEPPNLFEFLLGKGAGKNSEGRPICIIVEKTEENYEDLIAILCRDIFREKVGGKPTPIYKETIEELRHEFESQVEGKIIIIEKVEKSSKDLIQILKGFFSQNMGFLILVSTEPLKLEDEIRRRGELSANIVTVNPQPELEMIREKLLNIVRGKESIIQAESFGTAFKKSVESLEEDLSTYLHNLRLKGPAKLKYDWDRVGASSPDSNEDANEVHSAMKAFLWMYEWKKHEKQIIPKLEADGGEDVRIEEEDKNYEIETLFGAGDVRGKLTRKIKKYKERKGEKVYFVLKNVDILRNLALLWSFRRDWRKAGYTVEFFGLNLDKEELVPLTEFVELVRYSVH
jgi:hypothetical protein